MKQTILEWQSADLAEQLTNKGKLGKDVRRLIAFTDELDEQQRTYLGALAVYNRGAWRDPYDWEIIYEPSHFAILKLFPFED